MKADIVAMPAFMSNRKPNRYVYFEIVEPE